MKSLSPHYLIFHTFSHHCEFLPASRKCIIFIINIAEDIYFTKPRINPRHHWGENFFVDDYFSFTIAFAIYEQEEKLNDFFFFATGNNSTMCQIFKHNFLSQTLTKSTFCFERGTQYITIFLYNMWGDEKK